MDAVYCTSIIVNETDELSLRRKFKEQERNNQSMPSASMLVPGARLGFEECHSFHSENQEASVMFVRGCSRGRSGLHGEAALEKRPKKLSFFRTKGWERATIVSLDVEEVRREMGALLAGICPKHPSHWTKEGDGPESASELGWSARCRGQGQGCGPMSIPTPHLPLHPLGCRSDQGWPQWGCSPCPERALCLATQNLGHTLPQSPRFLLS